MKGFAQKIQPFMKAGLFALGSGGSLARYTGKHGAGGVPARQRDVLQSIAVESASIKDTAAKFSMSEGAVRVALHRGLTSLTAKLRQG